MLLGILRIKFQPVGFLKVLFGEQQHSFVFYNQRVQISLDLTNSDSFSVVFSLSFRRDICIYLFFQSPLRPLVNLVKFSSLYCLVNELPRPNSSSLVVLHSCHDFWAADFPSRDGPFSRRGPSHCTLDGVTGRAPGEEAAKGPKPFQPRRSEQGLAGSLEVGGKRTPPR